MSLKWAEKQTVNFTQVTFNLWLWKPLYVEDIAVCMKSNGSSAFVWKNQTVLLETRQKNRSIFKENTSMKWTSVRKKKKEQPFDSHEYCSFKACSEDFLVCQTVGGVSHAKLGTYLRDIQTQWISGIYISPFTSHGGHVLRRRWHHCETLPCLSPKQHVSLFKDQIIPPSLFCISFCFFSPFWGRAAHYFEEVMEHVRI